MYREPNPMRLMIALSVVITCIAVMVLLTRNLRDDVKDEYNEAIAVSNVRQGIVVDKDVKQVQSLFYKNPQPKYELTLKVTYTYNDEVKTTNITQIVDKETYLATNINDLFDITTLTATATDAN